jgi:hypothetical protein
MNKGQVLAIQSHEQTMGTLLLAALKAIETGKQAEFTAAWDRTPEDAIRNIANSLYNSKLI